jgi:hypothetical protein
MDGASASASNVLGGDGHNLPSTNEPQAAAVSTEECTTSGDGDVSAANDIIKFREEILLSLSVVRITHFATFTSSANKFFLLLFMMVTDNTVLLMNSCSTRDFTTHNL